MWLGKLRDEVGIPVGRGHRWIVVVWHGEPTDQGPSSFLDHLDMGSLPRFDDHEKRLVVAVRRLRLRHGVRLPVHVGSSWSQAIDEEVALFSSVSARLSFWMIGHSGSTRWSSR